MQHPLTEKGFTLVELVVVIALMSIMLVVAVPRFSAFLSTNNTDETLRWLIIKTRFLKERAVSDQKNYTLHIDMANSRLYITNEAMETEEELQEAVKSGYELPDYLRILDVEIFGTGIVTDGTATVEFNRRGYSDRVIIHMEDDEGQQYSVAIEPFLSRIRIDEHYASFNIPL